MVRGRDRGAGRLGVDGSDLHVRRGHQVPGSVLCAQRRVLELFFFPAQSFRVSDALDTISNAKTKQSYSTIQARPDRSAREALQDPPERHPPIRASGLAARRYSANDTLWVVLDAQGTRNLVESTI